jgi:MFS family permease
MSDLNSSFTQSALYSTAALWNSCLAMIQLLVPLYALSLGFSSLTIGGLVALPVLAQLVVRFVGSALADRFGERRILQGCYFLMTLSGGMLLGAVDFTTLLLAQAVTNFSQATFWISSQSLVSQLPGDNMGKKLGRLTASNYGGNLAGLILGGILAARLGYHNAFVVLTGMALCSFLLGFALPHARPKPSRRTVWEITLGIGHFLRHGQVWLVVSVSYAAALPVSLTYSLYPIHLAELNYGEEWIGAALSARAVGPVLIGSLLGSYITMARRKRIYGLGMAILGLFLVVSGLTEKIFLIGVCIALVGAAGGMMDILYQVQAAELSRAGDRSVAMASMGLGWNFSYLSIPILGTWFAERAGFRFAFLMIGIFFLLMGAGTRLWHRLLESTEVK